MKTLTATIGVQITDNLNRTDAELQALVKNIIDSAKDNIDTDPSINNIDVTIALTSGKITEVHEREFGFDNKPGGEHDSGY